MLKHAVYFDLLGSLDENAPERRSTLAGLLVLRLVDWRLDDGASHEAAAWASVESIRRVLLEVSEGDPIRATLLNLLDTASVEKLDPVEVGRALMSYGRALNFTSRWALAADVFETVDKVAAPRLVPRLSIAANIALGAASRRAGGWDASAHAYSRAMHIAHAVGDEAALLQIDVGIANTDITRGNLPGAESLLDNVIERARSAGFDAVLGMALHSRVTVAHQRGLFADAVRLGYNALEVTTDRTARDAILGDLAAAFGGLGMHDAARDGYMIVAVTSQSQWARWQATLNLMELAAMDGQESLFDEYVRELEQAPLPPRLRAYYLLFMGNGQRAFGRHAAAESSLAGGFEFATRNQLHQIAHEASNAIAALQSRQTVSLPATTTDASPPAAAVAGVAAALSGLRHAATSSP
jgi:hypothetical protein